MNVKPLILWHATLAGAAALPGALDPSFAPEMRANAAASAVVAPDGKIWVTGGFDEADGTLVGDWVVLGPDGGVERDAVPGYLSPWPEAFAVSIDGAIRFPIGGRAELFPLAGGSCLVPNGSGRWLRADPTGVVSGPAFPDQVAGEPFSPQFERDGKLVVIRTFGDGRVALELRNAGDGSLVPSFAQAEGIPADPVAAVAGPEGKLWVLGSRPTTAARSALPWTPDFSLFRLDGSGAVDLSIEPRRLPSFRSHTLFPGPGGAVRIAMGPDISRWDYWPAPETSVHRLEFLGAAGDLQRREDFGVPLGTPFAWAGNTDGKVVATGADGRLVAWTGTAGGTTDPPQHLVDPSFTSPGRVTSVNALPDGKWLVDGVRRLLSDGSDDPTWTLPRLDRPAEIRELDPMPGGGMLVSGNFSTVEGDARPRLAVLRADGTPDPGFVLDPRVGGVESAAVQGDSVFAVTTWPVDFGSGRSSNLVKLKANGTLDVDFAPELGIFSLRDSPSISSTNRAVLSVGARDRFTRVHATVDGKILAERISNGGDVSTRTVHRLNANGSSDSAFARWSSYNSWGDLLAVEDGGAWIGGELLDRNGGLVRDLTVAGTVLRPLCEWQGGVLFFASRDGNTGRLKLWKGRSWVRGFAAPAVDSPGLIATPGEAGFLYLQASFGGSRLMLRRLKADGRIDPTLRAPRFESPRRREGDWWTTGGAGREEYRPGPDEAGSAIGAMRWDRESQRLWVAGAFNRVDDQPRDGIARILGGTAGRGGRRNF